MATLKVYDGSNWVPVAGGSFSQSRNQSLVISGDWRGAYATSQYIKVLPMDTANIYPNGITITSWYLNCSSADPTTEINANLRYCDAQGLGAFPGANIVLIDVLDTTTGNSQRTDMSGSSLGSGVIPAGKCIYIQMDADPLDLNIIWTLTINYTGVR